MGTSVMITSEARPILLKIRLGAAPARVRLQGVDLPRLSQSALDAAPSGWRHDAASGFLHIKLQHPGGVSGISF